MIRRSGVPVGVVEPRRWAQWTVETAADLLWALMSVDLLEELQHCRGWPVDAYAERLALVARRSRLRGS